MCIITLINIIFSEFETQFVGHNIDILAKLLLKKKKGSIANSYAFIQSNLHWIYDTHFTSSFVLPWKQTLDLYIGITEASGKSHFKVDHEV